MIVEKTGYDIIIIGAGPGGYVMAERAGHRGKKVLMIERAELGGVCLNWGCVPTKTLLNSAKHYLHAQEAENFGVRVGEVAFDLTKAMAWKSEVIEALRAGVAFLMKKNQVTVLKGEAEFIGPGRVQVDDVVYEGEHVVIATGSSPLVPPIPGAEQDHVMTSREILSIEKMPESLVVIGGGVIGIEFASFFSSFGVKVDVIEMLDEIVPFMDRAQAKDFRRAFKKKINFHLGCKVEAIEGHEVKYTDAKGAAQSISAEVVLMSVGRRPNVQDMGLEAAGVEMNRAGIVVDDQLRTNLPNVFAIGDVTGTAQLAHAASRMGEVALDVICGGDDRVNYDTIPWAIYSLPEAAGCGLTEDQAAERGMAVKTAKLPLRMSGRFLAENGKRAPGEVKVVVDAKTDKLLGVHMIGSVCSEMIFGATAMIEAGMKVADVQKIVFPHPTVGEVLRDTLFAL